MTTSQVLHHELRLAASLLNAQQALLLWRPEVAIVDAHAARSPLDPGWSDFLLGLDDDALNAFESLGVDADWADAPPSLQRFVDDVRRATSVPALLNDVAAQPVRRHEPLHKQQQVDAFAHLVARVADTTTRIVDVGSGHGHLTRALADAVSRPVLGLERDEALAAHARALAAAHATVDFVVADVLRGGLSVQPGDCVVGLHACGELGDVAVSAVAESAGAAAVVFVGCCLQKQRAEARVSLSASGLTLPKPLLGLSNLSAGDVGVEARRVDNLAGRRQRIALRLLLARAGVSVRPRAELEGLNRRAAHAPLPELVAVAFAVRHLQPPAAADIDEAFATASQLHERFRRLSLPRTLLGRVIEVFVVRDRAAYLAERGFDVDVGVVFPASLSPRNLALVAARR
jgi:protein-L-isoaspartate O-methyltransferase